MRTKYFKHTALNETAKRDVNRLAALPKDVLEQIMTWFESKETYPRFDDDDMVEVAQITDRTGEEVVDALGILRLFVNRIIDNDESVSDFYADIKDLRVVEEKVGYDGLDVVFRRLPALVDKFRLFHRKRQTQDYGAPVLTGSSMSATIKPIFPRKFEYGKDSLERYEPSPIGYCLVAQIELQKSDSAQFFSFQLNRENLDRFVGDLLALQAELVQMEKEVVRMTSSSK